MTYTMELKLCDNDGIVRSGAMHRGTDYECAGHAHYAGEHIRCTSPAHDASERRARLYVDELLAYAEERWRYARVRMSTDLAIDVHTALDKILATGRPLNERDREALQMVLDQARGELGRLIGFVWFTGAGFVFPACPTLVWEGDQA